MEFFSGQKNFDHASKRRIGVLLVNLGTPDAPTKRALKPYLKKFLADPRVIEISKLKWWFILNFFILPFRPKKSAELYRRIWTKEGSPLLVYSQRQLEALRKALGDDIIVELGMRIGEPGLEAAMHRLQDQGVDRLLVIPMFPQYSGTTTGSGFDGVVDELKKWRWIPELRMVMSFHDHPGYISALANSVREVWEKGGKPEKLIMSFHGIPKRYFEGGDPYHCYCRKTGRLLAEALGLRKEDYLITFQSLFGKEEWLRPYTNETLAKLGEEGVASVDVICPGFAADCLETLEEIEEENRHVFLESGKNGKEKRFRYIPALNDRDDFIAALRYLVLTHIQGWERPAGDPGKYFRLFQEEQGRQLSE